MTKLNLCLLSGRYTCFPQLTSRICHRLSSVYSLLQTIILKVLTTYPQQALWSCIALHHSRLAERQNRLVANVIYRTHSNWGCLLLAHVLSGQRQYSKRLRNKFLATRECYWMPVNRSATSCSNYLTHIQRKMWPHSPWVRETFARSETCCRSIWLSHCNINWLQRFLQRANPTQTTILSRLLQSRCTGYMKRYYFFFYPTPLARNDNNRTQYQVEIMNSLQRPKKITLVGSNGADYLFLCKPKDDLRKDCRMMEFNQMINKLLKKHPDSRRRNLRTPHQVKIN